MCKSEEKEIRFLLKKIGILSDADEKYYIYGAANNAKQFLEFLKVRKAETKIKGFLVTDITKNPKWLEGLPVFDVHEFEDKKANILVPHAGVYKQEIFSLLKKLQYEKVYSVLNLMHFMKEEISMVVSDNYMQEAQKWEKELREKRTEDEKKKNQQLIEKIIKIQKKGNPDFGGAEFYQSLEEIGIRGIRPTRYRILRYGLNDILKKDFEILDIGCNSGFFDISVSNQVSSITGVEYDDSLVFIAECVRKYMKIENCFFVNADFNDWYKEQKQKFDVIFSFAIHHWLNVEPDIYADRLDSLLKSKGFICIESHDLTRKADFEYEECIKNLLNKGYVVRKRENIMDDGITRRNFAILHKK